MDRLKYLHFCNHTLYEPSTAELSSAVVYNAGVFDNIPETNPVTTIHNIFLISSESIPPPSPIDNFTYDNNDDTYEDGANQGFMDFDTTDTAYFVNYTDYLANELPLPYTFYELQPGNRIKWKVRPPIVFEIIYDVKPIEMKENKFIPTACPLCQGNGWYIDIFAYRESPEEAVGIGRVAQRIIKDLLTLRGENMFDSDYGGIITKLLTPDIYVADEQMFEQITGAVREVETNYLRQQAMIGDVLSDDEILQRLTLQQVSRSTENPTKIILEIAIQTFSDQRVLRLPI